MALKLWHQSSTVLSNQTYRELILRHAKRVLPEAVIDLHGVRHPSASEAGGAPVNARDSAFGQMLTDVQCARHVIQAEDEGYDAFVYTCFNDPGLIEGRGMVDIPVVGLCETSVLTAMTMGRSIGIIGANRHQTNRVIRTLHLQRIADRVRCVLPMTRPWTGGYSGDGPDGGASVVDSFVDAARRAIEQGVDVLISGEGPVNILLAERGVCEVDGVRVLDSWSAVLKRAEMLVSLRRAAPVAAASGRSGQYAGIPRDVALELAAAAAGVLRDGWSEPV